MHLRWRTLVALVLVALQAALVALVLVVLLEEAFTLQAGIPREAASIPVAATIPVAAITPT